jgi:hypothetical protein
MVAVCHLGRAVGPLRGAEEARSRPVGGDWRALGQYRCDDRTGWMLELDVATSAGAGPAARRWGASSAQAAASITLWVRFSRLANENSAALLISASPRPIPLPGLCACVTTR